jgi:DNA-binding LacI/PurR family transcriptional regulator
MSGSVTIRDVCRETGVSVATVSRVLNNQPKVSKEKRAFVLEAIRRLGYTPNALARSLSKSRTDTLGVLLGQELSDNAVNVLRGIEMEAHARAFRVLLGRASADASSNEGGGALVDGLIVLDPMMSRQTIAAMHLRGRPLVMVQNRAGEASVSTVCASDEQGAYVGLKHILSMGHRKLLLISGPPGGEDSVLRMKGCDRALREFKLSPEEAAMMIGRYSPREALTAFREYRTRRGLPRAVFAFGDETAMAVMKELRVTGVRVPDEVAVIGFGGAEAGDYMGLTTIRVPTTAMGVEAVRVLAERIRDPQMKAAHIVMPCELVIRESCGGACNAS